MSVAAAGGFYLPLPTRSQDYPPGYTMDRPLHTRIARELSASLEDLVTTHAADLTPHTPSMPMPGQGPHSGVQTQMLYRTLVMSIEALDRQATADVYQDLSTRQDINLKAVGIKGRLSAGDVSAILEIEKDLPRLTSAFDTIGLSQGVMGLDLRKNLPAAHVLARMALSDTTILGLEGGLVFQLGATHSLEFLPYPVVMLQSPDPSTRDISLMQMCELLSPGGFWQPEMSNYCPRSAPMNDREQQRRDLEFWMSWWKSHRDAIAEQASLPEIAVPSRYYVARQEVQQAGEVPMEVRLQVLVNMGHDPGHYHSETGEIVAGPAPGPRDPLITQLSPADRESYEQILDAIRAKLDAQQKHATEILNAARMAGTRPNQTSMEALNAEREAALKTGVQDLQTKLSPQGWQSVERFLKSMGIGMARPMPNR